MKHSFLTSKICLSLKSLNGINFEEISKIIRNIELRLDYIKISEINFEKIASLFDTIILKINNLEQLIQIVEKMQILNITDNIIYDIDNKIFNINHKIIIELLNNSLYIVSFHNIKYNDTRKILNNQMNLSNERNNYILKIVIKEDVIKYSKELLLKIYQIYKNQLNINLISFFEGTDYTASRYHSILLGSPFLYASIDCQNKTGEGQPTIFESLRMIKLLGSFCQNNQSNQ